MQMFPLAHNLVILWYISSSIETVFFLREEGVSLLATEMNFKKKNCYDLNTNMIQYKKTNPFLCHLADSSASDSEYT